MEIKVVGIRMLGEIQIGGSHKAAGSRKGGCERSGYEEEDGTEAENSGGGEPTMATLHYVQTDAKRKILIARV